MRTNKRIAGRPRGLSVLVSGIRSVLSYHRYGFTLAELIVVITILAILATVGFLSLSEYASDARDARMKANVRSVRSAIAAESALSGNSPRWYVEHDPEYALSGTYLYVDGDPFALTGGNVSDTSANYTAGRPRWDRLKLDSDKFSFDSIPYFPMAFASFDYTAIAVGSVDVQLPSSGSRVRTVSYFQAAGILPDSGKAVVTGDFPAPSAADIVASESNGKPIASGLVKDPKSGSESAIADGAVIGSVVSDGGGSGSSGGAEPQPSDCALPWGGTLAHGASVNAYQASTASYPSSCVSESRTCTNGVLSGTYASSACAYQPSCPSGFIFVPGSPGVSVAGASQVIGWCVAKYEMSYSNFKSGQAGCSYGEPYATCGTPRGALAVTSQANASPVNYISRNEAESLCSGASYLKDQEGNGLSGGHLVSVAIWKKIADDISAQGVNWSGNSPGFGYMSRGYANYAASEPTSCQPGTARVCTTKSDDADSTVSTSAVPTGTYSKRSWKLSNGSWIHDFSGNVWEWFYETHSNSANGWSELSDFATGKPTFGGVSLRPSDTAWNSSKGTGKIYFNDTTSGAVSAGSTLAANYSGTFDSAADAGVFASVWAPYSPSTVRHNTVGFRCVVPAK